MSKPQLFTPIPLLASLAVLSFGCTASPADVADGDDPLKALTVVAASTRYDDQYWMWQKHTGTELFGDALDYCQGFDPGERPNCRPVLAAHRYLEGLEAMQRPRRESRGYTGVLSEDSKRAQ